MFRAKARSPIAESASESRTGLGIENQMNRIHTNVAARLLIALGLFCASPAPGRAQTRPQDLASATLEDLLNIQITSASRKEQREADVIWMFKRSSSVAEARSCGLVCARPGAGEAQKSPSAMSRRAATFV